MPGGGWLVELAALEDEAGSPRPWPRGSGSATRRTRIAAWAAENRTG
ncbi:hypothetical protein [Streptomyces kronopolitis]